MSCSGYQCWCQLSRDHCVQDCCKPPPETLQRLEPVADSMNVPQQGYEPREGLESSWRCPNLAFEKPGGKCLLVQVRKISDLMESRQGSNQISVPEVGQMVTSQHIYRSRAVGWRRFERRDQVEEFGDQSHPW